MQTAVTTDGHVTYDGGTGTLDKLVISLTAAQAGNATLLAQIAALVPGAGLNGTLNAGGVNLTAQGWENFAVAVEVGGSFQPLNILFGTANHQNGTHTPVLTVPGGARSTSPGRSSGSAATTPSPAATTPTSSTAAAATTP